MRLRWNRLLGLGLPLTVFETGLAYVNRKLDMGMWGVFASAVSIACAVGLVLVYARLRSDT